MTTIYPHRVAFNDEGIWGVGDDQESARENALENLRAQKPDFNAEGAQFHFWSTFRPLEQHVRNDCPLPCPFEKHWDIKTAEDDEYAYLVEPKVEDDLE